jgi:argininosuccinate synthase
LIERLNREAGALGVGRGYHLGDTVLGIKGRIAFEAPAAEILLASHRELEKLVLTEEQRFWKDHLGDVYGRRLHQGLFHDPFQRDLEAFFASTQSRVTGTARVRLSNGSLLVEGVSSPFSLLAASDARYGERPATGSDAAGAVGLARVLAEPARLYRRAGESAEASDSSESPAQPLEVVR